MNDDDSYFLSMTKKLQYIISIGRAFQPEVSIVVIYLDLHTRP